MVDKEDIGDFTFTQKNREMFQQGSTVQSSNLVQGFSQCMVISPAGKWDFGLVYVVITVYPFES